MRSPKMSSLVGPLQEVVTYKNLDQLLGQNFTSLEYVTAEAYTMF